MRFPVEVLLLHPLADCGFKELLLVLSHADFLERSSQLEFVLRRDKLAGVSGDIDLSQVQIFSSFLPFGSYISL